MSNRQALFIIYEKFDLCNKNAPRGSHCGGEEGVAKATHRRRRIPLAGFFFICCNMLGALFFPGGFYQVDNGIHSIVEGAALHGILILAAAGVGVQQQV